jgi:NADPH:quinone reductase-like Zn-dependent oxidoreductase
MFNHRRAFTVQLAAEVIRRLDDGTYTPLPATTYDACALTEAFSVVARGTQQGRVVVNLGGNPPVRPAIPSFPVRADGTYLVTGAFGAVGLAMVDWLVSRGTAPDRRQRAAPVADAPNGRLRRGAPARTSGRKPSTSATHSPSRA